MTDKLCIDCKFYAPAEREIDDKCVHKEAKYGGVRDVRHYPAHAMRAGICGTSARLFEQRTCECGAAIKADELTCAGCTAQYRAEEREDLDRKFPSTEP